MALMTSMNIAEAKSKLSELVARAEAGEEVIIARGGKPVVRLVATEPPKRRKPRLGVWSHLGANIPQTLFLEPDPELEALMDAPIDPTRR